AIAAAVLIAIGVGGWFMFNKHPAQTPITASAAPSGSQVTTTGATAAPIAAGQGVLLLSAQPWGDIEKIVNAKDQKPVTLSDDHRSTPTRIELAPGKYFVTMSGPAGKQQTFDVEIDAGKPTQKKIEMDNINLDELEKEMSKQ